MVSVWIISLGFIDWDQCWNYYHANRALMDGVTISEFCVAGEAVEPCVAPCMTHSLRPPKGRQDD